MSTYTKRAQTLITLIGQVIQSNTLADLNQVTKQLLNVLVSDLIKLATIDDPASEIKFSGVSVATQKTLGKILNAMPAKDFLDSIEFMLTLDSAIVCVISFNLLENRLPYV